MPLFEYKCPRCNYGFDKIVQRWDTQVKCPLCQGKVEKMISTFSVGSPHTGAGQMPAEMGPKICTNC